MPTIFIQDQYASLVDNTIAPLFAGRGIKITNNAQYLIALTMQSQIEENVMNTVRLGNLAEQVVSPSLVDYYIGKYGEREMNFNRAFHLLSDIGFVLKFPLIPTRPPLPGTI